MHCLLHARHEDITLLVPHYVHSTCHNLQRHTEHMIRAYTTKWTQTAVCLSHRGRLSFDCSTSTSTARNFVPPCASDSRGWHTYRLVQIERPKLCPREFLTPFFRVRPRNFAHIFWKAVSKTLLINLQRSTRSWLGKAWC